MVLRARSMRFAYSVSMVALLASLSACGTATTEAPSADTAQPDGTETAAGDSGVTGAVLIDGSSTVFPISEAIAEEFMAANTGVQVTVGVSGTGGGFEKFCAGETDVSNASRPIKDEEVAKCAEGKVEFIEVPMAYDGLTIVTNKDNDWAQCLTVEQLKIMWEPAAEGKITSWKQIDPAFPDEKLALYGPGTDSGTFDYFTDEINGEEGASRGDYTASEDDNLIVQGVKSAKGGAGYFGYAYYEENAGALKDIQVKNEAGTCVEPTPETIADGSYNPLSRPLYFYVSKAAYDSKPQVKAFVDFHLDPANQALVKEAGYVPLPDDALGRSKARVDSGKVGSDPKNI
jgi:phosphate transport system substrate-binding protein